MFSFFTFRKKRLEFIGHFICPIFINITKAKHSTDVYPFQLVVVPDPGGELKAWNFAKKVHAKFLMTPDKIDDLINENQYNRDWLASMYQQARRG